MDFLTNRSKSVSKNIKPENMHSIAPNVQKSYRSATKMWFQILLGLILPFNTFGLDIIDVNFSIEYFKYRGIKLICLLSCEKDVFWSLKFSKSAIQNSIAVSKVSIDHMDADFNSLRQCLEYDLHSTGVVLDGNCEETENVLYFASENMFYSSQHKWLIIENDDAIPSYYNNSEIDTEMIYEKGHNTVIGTLGNLNISVDADIVVGSRDNTGHYTLYDVFNFGKIQGGYLIVSQIGSWNIEDGLKLDLDLNEYKYYRRYDFQNWVMRMILVVGKSASKNEDLNVLLGLEPVPGVAHITQAAGGILCLVAEIHNIRFNHTFADRWIGTFERNNTKVVANSLYFREQDISPTIRMLSTIRDKIDLLLPPLTTIETRYYYRIPTTGPGKFENQFLMPLSPVAWWGVIGISILCAIVLLMSARLEQRPASVYEDIDDGATSRISSARKVTILVTGLSCVLIYNYYTSSVVSWLLNGPPPSINSLRELLNSPLELIYEDIGYSRSWLQTPSYYFNKRNAKIEDELRQKKVFNKKKDAPLLEPVVQGIKMVQKGGYAFHTEVNNANTLISKTFDQTELCELGSLQSMEKASLYACVQKNSPYKEFLSWSLMRLLERGFISRIESRTSAPEVKCEGSSPRALALGGAAPAFILLAGGYLLATTIMLFERFVYNIKTNRIRTTN